MFRIVETYTNFKIYDNIFYIPCQEFCLFLATFGDLHTNPFFIPASMPKTHKSAPLIDFLRKKW